MARGGAHKLSLNVSNLCDSVCALKCIHLRKIILLHILFFLIFNFFYLNVCIFSCVVLHILHCSLSGPDPNYISLLIIFCIIEYVTNKTFNP